MHPEPATEKLARIILASLKVWAAIVGSFLIVLALLLALVVRSCNQAMDKAAAGGSEKHEMQLPDSQPVATPADIEAKFAEVRRQRESRAIIQPTAPPPRPRATYEGFPGADKSAGFPGHDR